MERSKLRCTVDMSVEDILKRYLLLGCVKSIKRLSLNDGYKITFNETESRTKVAEINRLLRRCGYQTRVSSCPKRVNKRHRGLLDHQTNLALERCIFAKVAAPRPPINPDDFDPPQKRRLMRKRRG